ncbi:MAG: hypothetical protein SFW09_04060 [Hyphomicrobiaceae bacterium]|nr:hypothetical protein [Hyphomicrobiaceae bacterium]
MTLLVLIFTRETLAETDWPPRPVVVEPRESSREGNTRRPVASPQRAPAAKPARTADADTGAKQPAKPEEAPRPKLGSSQGRWRWRVERTEWSSDDERDFEAFVARIGEDDCDNVHRCLTSPTANPRFHDKHPPAMRFFADCADLPFMLRAYFAWQRQLPFSFSVRYASHPPMPGQKGKLHGNRIADRYDIVGPGPDPRLALPAVHQFVSSEHFRTPPLYQGDHLPDHYPVQISRESIRPGTVIFDPDGHLAVVYKVTDDGRVLYIDAHPDNTLTRGVFNREFSRAEPAMGAGFKNWRPQKLVGARPGKDGLVGGKVVLSRDSELSDWSVEQFFGTGSPRPASWTDAVFELGGKTLEYHDYVRLKLAYSGFKYKPIEEMRTAMRQLCRDLEYRVTAVNLSIKANIHKRPVPDRLPPNIYATKGDWETYSTPSRDARIKTAFEELRDETARFLALSREKNDVLDYTGSDLRSDLLAVYHQEAAACQITYTRSDGSPIRLGFEEIKRRLFRLSFDPHHCVERRWGADDPEELRTCTDDRLKSDWYAAQDRLRNQLVRTYGEAMGWNLAQMQDQALDIGIAEPPDVDTLKVLLGDEVKAVTATTGLRQARAARRQEPKR